MCGICGAFESSGIPEAGAETISRMTEAITHRGPDSQGIMVDADSKMMFGHRRLAIIDLSDTGHQPMDSNSGVFTIIYNGEIYNHLELREDLERSKQAPQWNGSSDTETLLACIESWGIERALQAATGMFAFAVLDRNRGELVLARDRLGEKPLYYGWQGQTFLFASDLTALKVHPKFRAEIDRQALALYLRFGCIPEPYSIYTGIQKLVSGTYLTIKLGARSRRPLSPTPYWELSEVISQGKATPFEGSASEAVDAVDRELSAAVRSQLISDVPLGAFLSGGIDSSLIVAMMQEQSGLPVRTFTIGSTTSEYNEAEHARAVATHLGTEHTELIVGSDDLLAVVADLPTIYSEPFADSSQVPSYLVSHLARSGVTVALSGDGGDEIFGGYNRYLSASRIWKASRRWPAPLRDGGARILTGVSPHRWDALFDSLRLVLPRSMHTATPGDKMHKLASVLSAQDGPEYYRSLTSQWEEPGFLVNVAEPHSRVTFEQGGSEDLTFEEWMMAMDTLTYLPDDILTKVDRAAMANGLETRAPFLDHRVVELAWRMPIDFRIRNGQGKWLLRQALNRRVPEELINRPKMGFGLPIGDWLRGPLRDWADSLINAERLVAEGYFQPDPIRQAWAEHQSGKTNNGHKLWIILMFQVWLDSQKR